MIFLNKVNVFKKKSLFVAGFLIRVLWRWYYSYNKWRQVRTTVSVSSVCRGAICLLNL